MKNLFFALAFMLVGTFAFANTEIEVPAKSSILENVVDLNETLLDNNVTNAVSLETENLECGFQFTFTDDYGSTSYFEDCSFSGGLGDYQDWTTHILDWLAS